MSHGVSARSMPSTEPKWPASTIPIGPGALRRSVAVLVAIGLVCSVVVPSETGCTNHLCDSSQVAWSGGEMIDADTYESGPLDGAWLTYGGNETLMVTYPDEVQNAIAGRTPAWAEPYVGISRTPNFGPDFADGGNWTPASGQLALLHFVGPKGFWVTNGSCQVYFLRVVVHFPELAAGIPSDGSAGRGPDAAGGADAEGVPPDSAADTASDGRVP